MALHAALLDPPAWLLSDARSLFRAATSTWGLDGTDGFVYTVDWEGRPVVRQRMHWVVAEAIGAAAALGEVTGESSYDRWFERLWDYADRHLVDRDHGSWHHELGPDNRPAYTVWRGKPDVYHAFQATLLSRLPAAGSLLAALR
jgi:mannose/cellobiose epimerase-like protein (N-acyl-D-glucosamine 2-epimerase family)